MQKSHFSKTLFAISQSARVIADANLRHPGKYNWHFLPIKTSGCTSQDGVN
jgi:hypothetical protein